MALYSPPAPSPVDLDAIIEGFLWELCELGPSAFFVALMPEESKELGLEFA